MLRKSDIEPDSYERNCRHLLLGGNGASAVSFAGVAARCPEGRSNKVSPHRSNSLGPGCSLENSDGTLHEFFQFNDRGRGPKIYAAYRLNGRGLLVSEESHGSRLHEEPLRGALFDVSGLAAWKNQAEHEKQPNAEGRFYIDLNGGPE